MPQHFSLFRHNFTSLLNYFHFRLIIFRRYGIILCGQNDNNKKKENEMNLFIMIINYISFYS